MKVDMRNVYILCAVILATILVAYYLFTQNRLEMFQILSGKADIARMDQEMQDYVLKAPKHQ